MEVEGMAQRAWGGVLGEGSLSRGELWNCVIDMRLNCMIDLETGIGWPVRHWNRRTLYIHHLLITSAEIIHTGSSSPWKRHLVAAFT